MKIELSGPWNQKEVDAYLADAQYPVRLSCVAADGYPRVVSLWYRYQQASLYCVTHRASKIAGLLASNDRVGFEVSPNEPPYLGVRGQGIATLAPLEDRSMFQGLLEHYLGDTDSDLARWLLARSEEEVVIRIQPKRLFSWDYRHRMKTDSQ